VKRYDYYEPRVFGRFLVNPKYYELGITGNSDPRRAFSIEFAGDFMKSYGGDFDIRSQFITFSPRLRFSDHLSLEWEISKERIENEPGYVSQDETSNNIYFGERNRQTVVNIIEASYIFNNSMSLCFRLRHYWSKANYDSYYELMEDGNLRPSLYNNNHNLNYNAFNIDLTFRWNFAPGSEILLNWKNSLYLSDQRLINSYWENFSNTLKGPHINSLSVKFLYYFDL
jgi:hypothetical protein